jgi:hypothetical protein
MLRIPTGTAAASPASASTGSSGGVNLNIGK